MNTYQIRHIHDVITVGATLSRSWFRGHSRAVGQLTPRIHRPEFTDDLMRDARPALEMQIIEAFKREVPTLAEVPVPAEDDRLGWLYVMQHYRTPTRLLDWSQNVLVAMHFVVAADRKEDGELWVLYPEALNQKAHVGFGIPLPDNNPVLSFLINEPYWAGTAGALAAKHEIEIVPNRPVAFEPSRRFPRLVRQSGAFTIHPAPTPGNSIPEVLEAPAHLVRSIVPAGAKHQIDMDLAALGIDEYALFPELWRACPSESNWRPGSSRTHRQTPPECGGAVAQDL